jgi:hypothetical protein
VECDCAIKRSVQQSRAGQNNHDGNDDRNDDRSLRAGDETEENTSFNAVPHGCRYT